MSFLSSVHLEFSNTLHILVLGLMILQIGTTVLYINKPLFYKFEANPALEISHSQSIGAPCAASRDSFELVLMLQ